MAQFEVALLALGKLIGLMDATGSVKWTWFGNPFQESMTGIPANRGQFGALLRALVDLPPVDKSPYFDETAKLQWEFLGPAEAKFGFVWNEENVPLQLGFGALGTIPIGSRQLTVDALARILEISGAGDVSSALGAFRFGAGFPVPDFLQSISVHGLYPDPNHANDLTFGLTVADAVENRTLNFPSTKLQWDFPRLAAFVLHAWVKKQAGDSPAAPKGFFRRVDEHFYPMLGTPSSSIDAFPLISDQMGTDPDFDPWKDSILTTDANAAGALTFLWHLRALVTGNEDPNVFPGSSWFPLVTGSQGPGAPAEPQAFPPGGAYPPDPDVPGAWIGVREVPENAAEYELVLVLRNGQGPLGVRSISLLRLDTNNVRVRPALAPGTVADLSSFLSGMPPIDVGTGSIQFDAASGRLTLVSETLTDSPVTALNGPYSMDLVLRDTEPIAFRVNAPLIGMEMPPNVSVDDIETLFVNLLQWAVSEVTSQNAGKWGDLTHDLVQFLTDTIQQGSPDPNVLFAAVAAVMSEVAGTIQFGPISIGVSGTELVPGVEVGPIAPDKLSAKQIDYYIGKIKLTASLDLASLSEPLQGFEVSIYDVRLGTGGGTTGSGLVASLVPDMRDMKGFQLSVGWEYPDKINLAGGGKIPIQKTIGPLDIVALLVDVRDNSLSVGIDLAFQLAMIKVAVYELGIRFPFGDGDPEVFLHGLALGFDGGGIKLSGMFAEVKQQDGSSDYVGGAVVSIVNLFDLSAIGAYTETGGEASLFIFASLVAPLGGPPWFFVTGIAGGFGYNRSLPPPGMVTDHPFIKVMRGEIPIGGGADAIAAISVLFSPQKGSYWIAAGIQFMSFGFINGKVIVTVSFGNRFSFGLLGLASFGIKPLAYFELGLEVTADEEHFLLKAGLSPNSYIIHPDIFSLRGDFGLGVWYASPHAGDFILSIGGYHPFFETPEHYPELARVGVKCIVYGFVRLSVECFFACTPQALMAGASITLAAEFEGIGVGLDVYIDVFIRWDPFFLQARMGIVLWFEFLGRHEIGVELTIHTPPLGGTATIDLALVSFDVDFGSSLSAPPSPKLDQFITRQLGAPAERNDTKAVVSAFNTDAAAGLFRLDLLYGRTTKPQSSSAKQEGIGTPLSVDAEFAFTVKSKIPVNEDSPNGPLAASLSGQVDLGLCDKKDLETLLTVDGPSINQAQQTRLANFFPIANFGEALSAAQADDTGARTAVAKTAAGDPAIALTEGISFDYQAKLKPFPATLLVGLAEEDSQADEEFPLPVGWPHPHPQTWRVPKGTIAYKDVPLAAHITPKTPKKSLQEAALEQVQSRAFPPLVIWQCTGDLQRYQVGAQFKGLTVTLGAPIAGPIRPGTAGEVRPPTGTKAAAPAPESPVIAVPSSPQRRAELFGVNLRIVAPRAPFVLQKGRLETLTRARNFTRKMLADGVRESFTASAEIFTGKAVTLELVGGRRPKQTLTLSGTQTVRAIFQGGAEDVIGDYYFTGSRKVVVPVRARRLTLIGEGDYPPIRTVEGRTGPSSSVLENLGIEHDSTVLALGRRVFAGHGCVLVANTSLPFSMRPLDSVPGFEVMRGCTNFTIFWPSLQNGSLVLTAEPIDSKAGLAVEQVRWAAMSAQLTGLSTVVGSAATALVMDLEASEPWRLELDLGTHWRLTGVVIVAKPARNMTDWLKTSPVWDLVDDRLQAGAEPLVTTAVLEVAQ